MTKQNLTYVATCSVRHNGKTMGPLLDGCRADVVMPARGTLVRLGRTGGGPLTADERAMVDEVKKIIQVRSRSLLLFSL